MVSWSAGRVEGEGDAQESALPGPAHATEAEALWLRADHPKRSQEGCTHESPVAAHGEGLSRHGQKRRRVTASASALPYDAQLRVKAQKMSVALFEDAEEAGAAVVDESPHDDVDMGTPTAVNTKNSSWSDASATRDDCEVDGKWDRIRGSLQEAASGHRQTQEDDAHSPPPMAHGVELLAFREYNDADIDSLEILPSQDYGGGISEDEGRIATSEPVERSAQVDAAPWQDFRDDTQQYEEEASEVFDNVIYAPRAAPAQTPQVAQPPRRAQTDLDDMYESESELSDGFEVSLSFAPVLPGPHTSKAASSTAPAPVHSDASRPSSASSSRSDSASHQWHARLSVKRDCSFIDCTNTKKQPRAEARVEELSDSSDEFGEKLKLVDRVDDDSRSGRSTSTKPSTSTATSTATSVSPMEALKTESSVPDGFCPRKKKRRKVRQLPLDAFLTSAS